AAGRGSRRGRTGPRRQRVQPTAVASLQAVHPDRRGPGQRRRGAGAPVRRGTRCRSGAGAGADARPADRQRAVRVRPRRPQGHLHLLAGEHRPRSGHHRRRAARAGRGHPGRPCRPHAGQGLRLQPGPFAAPCADRARTADRPRHRPGHDPLRIP
ncbi:hypothetical protein OY671_012139, partial [Metschnikowia pulcherrima]